METHPIISLDVESNESSHNDIQTRNIRRHDYAMVFPLGNKEECEKVKKRLTEQKLELTEHLSRDKDEMFVLITASIHVLEEHAETMLLKKKMKQEFGGAYAEFKRSEKSKYESSNDPNSFFTTYERAAIIFDIIEDDDRARIGI